MSRKARIKDVYGTFYIYQRANDILFRTDCDRKRFLNILQQAQKKLNFLLYAYCITSPYEYHLVLNVNGGDLSNIMKCINITYAMQVNCDSKLFKDRYKSKLLDSETEILTQIENIHNKYQNNIWNSYCVHNGLSPINVNEFNDINCPHCLKNIEEAKKELLNYASENNLTLNEVLTNKPLRNQLIHEFRKNSTLSLKELGEVFGGLSESAVCKILNNIIKEEKLNENIQ